MTMQILKRKKLNEYSPHTNPSLEFTGATVATKWTFTITQPVEVNGALVEARIAYSGRYKRDYDALLLDLDILPSITTEPLTELPQDDLDSLKRMGTDFLLSILENNR